MITQAQMQELAKAAAQGKDITRRLARALDEDEGYWGALDTICTMAARIRAGKQTRERFEE